MNFIDTSFIVPLLSGQIGMERATWALSIFGSRAQSVAGIPPVLSIALSASLIPIISAAFARKDEQHLQRQITLAMRVSILTGTPVVLSLVVAAYSVNGLLFKTLDGSGIVAMLTLGTIFPDYDDDYQLDPARNGQIADIHVLRACWYPREVWF
ncbi:hypothetical protein ACFSQ7_09635 [Paenibacillus rhizoplanae]